jgi:hypothetical protein
VGKKPEPISIIALNGLFMCMRNAGRGMWTWLISKGGERVAGKLRIRLLGTGSIDD